MAPAWRVFDELAAGLSASVDHEPSVRAGQSNGNTPFVREQFANEPCSASQKLHRRRRVSIDTGAVFVALQRILEPKRVQRPTPCEGAGGNRIVHSVN
jgi:hypothetical protein